MEKLNNLIQEDKSKNKGSPWWGNLSQAFMQAYNGEKQRQAAAQEAKEKAEDRALKNANDFKVLKDKGAFVTNNGDMTYVIATKGEDAGKIISQYKTARTKSGSERLDEQAANFNAIYTHRGPGEDARKNSDNALFNSWALGAGYAAYDKNGKIAFKKPYHELINEWHIENKADNDLSAEQQRAQNARLTYGDK